MTQRINESIAKEFADAHEEGQASLSSEMDLLNNEIGRNERYPGWIVAYRITKPKFL